jgi:hypothetical protein
VIDTLSYETIIDWVVLNVNLAVHVIQLYSARRVFGITFIRYAQGNLFWIYKTRLTPHIFNKVSEERAVISMYVKGCGCCPCFYDLLLYNLCTHTQNRIHVWLQINTVYACLIVFSIYRTTIKITLFLYFNLFKSR